MNLQVASQNQRPPIQIKGLPYEEKLLHINYNLQLNFVELKGWSVSDNVSAQYDDLILKVNQFLESQSELILSFKLEMFNTTTVKYLLSIIKLMNKAHKLGKQMKIYWRVNANRDDEMTEVGLDLSLMSNFEFKIITDNSTFNTTSIEDKQAMNHRKLLFRSVRTKAAA
ncbi:SiaC family regulatory phosphoprotein [Ekhidna sp.]